MRQVHELNLEFIRPAGTSKGVWTHRRTWIFSEQRPGGLALGEAGPLSWLSVESADDVRADAETWRRGELIPACASVTMAREMVWRDRGDHVLFDSPFTRGETSLRINGLVWMGERCEIESQIRSLLDRGFRCLKMKVGALDWEQERAVLRAVRAADPDVELRVDANGAWSPSVARIRLAELAEVGVRSIEQPIAPGQWQEMAQLCEEAPIDVALDEELIRADDPDALLTTVRPQGIVLKPSLIGGFAAAESWIAAAARHGAYWWATSALESAVGLSALAQWCAVQSGAVQSGAVQSGDGESDRIHGLGTGGLYVRNFGSPLRLRGERLSYDPEACWDLSLLNG
jgi:o-succinylbenzoate synthase